MGTKYLFWGRKGSSVLQVNEFVPVKPEVDTTDLKNLGPGNINLGIAEYNFHCSLPLSNG